MAKDFSLHIGIFGKRNVGKSSIINALAGQDISIVSHIAGTTTDPVKKSIELLGAGPVILIDTAGIDDIGELGSKRSQKSLQVIKTIDMAILVIANSQFDHFEETLIKSFTEFDIPFFILNNKADMHAVDPGLKQRLEQNYQCSVIDFTTVKNINIEKVTSLILKNKPAQHPKNMGLFANMISAGDIILLITPIDTEAPEGRLILPQVQAIRDILDKNCVAIVAKESEVPAFLKQTQIEPKLVITDSSIFSHVVNIIPGAMPLTGFSILLARLRGPFGAYLAGTPHISKLIDGDRLLLLESCTHQTNCEDIGRVKLPRWILQFTGKKLEFDVVSGLASLQRPITDYAMVIQCGGCMITKKQVHSRLKPAIDAKIPVTNYGMAIAYVQEIYNRAIEPLCK